MIEQYYILVCTTLIVLVLGYQQAAKWWRAHKRATIRVGDRVVFPGARPRSLFYVVAVTKGHQPFHVQLVSHVQDGHRAPTLDVGADEVVLVARGGHHPTELEARTLNRYHGITCDTHLHEDCSHKARQRIARLLPGHQLWSPSAKQASPPGASPRSFASAPSFSAVH